MADHKDVPENESLPLTPGQRLAQARQDQGLSLEEIGEKLYLTVRQVTALENDDATPFGSLSYVRGYQRSYGKFLKLPELEVTATKADTREDPTDGNGVVVPNSLGRFDRLTNRTFWRLSVTLLVITVIGIIIWSLLRSFTDDTATLDEAAQTIETPLGPPRPAIIEPPTETEHGVLDEEPIREEIYSSNDENTGPTPAQELVEESLTTLPEVNFDPANDLTTTDDTELPSPVLVEAAPRPTVTVTFTFTEDSWTEVHDNTGKRLIYDLVKAGTVKQVEGIAPIEVFLGNSRAVTIVYNGAPFDHPKNRTVTRFTLDSESSEKPESADD